MDDLPADADLRPAPDAAELVPEALARTLRCVPVAVTPRTLSIAVATPLSGDQLRRLMELTGRQLISQLEPGADVVDELIESAYGTGPARA